MTTLTLAADAAPDQARDRAATTRTRVQFDLPPRSIERLNTLKRKTEAASYAEVVKNALRLYEALIEETEAGKQFLVRDEAGGIMPLRLFL
ncbi:MAG: hypothetical protein ACREFY_16665 [Acetobacteraceae bacterium]